MKKFENYLKYEYSIVEEILDDDLTNAIMNNDIEFIKEYLNKYDVNRLIYEDFPIIVLVNNNASLEIFKLFIDKGVKIDSQSADDNKTALLLLAENSYTNLEYTFPIIQLLVENGANINATTIKEDNALLLSIEYIRQSNKIQKYLIENNIDINQQDVYLDTVLNSEVYNSFSVDNNIHIDLILFLLEQKNIDLSIKDFDKNDFYDNLILTIEKIKKHNYKKTLENITKLIKIIEYKYPKIYEKFLIRYEKYKRNNIVRKFNL